MDKKKNDREQRNEDQENLLNQNSSPDQEQLAAEEIENLPPEIRKVVEMGFSMQRVVGSVPNPLLSKITESHISKILDLSEKEDDNSYRDAQSSKRYTAFYFLIGVLLFVFLVVFLVERNSSLLMSIIEKIIFIIAGFAGGYGYKAYLENKQRKSN
jgi:VIT1/CCC1 family predicted Fe2+/Mn2+ transporter